MKCELVSNENGVFLVFKNAEEVCEALEKNPALEYMYTVSFEGFFDAIKLSHGSKQNQKKDHKTTSSNANAVSAEPSPIEGLMYRCYLDFLVKNGKISDSTRKKLMNFKFPYDN